MGQGVVSKMSETMKDLGDVSAEEMNFDPTITPVLDLSEIETGAQRIAGLLEPSALNAGVSLAEAQNLVSALATQNGQNGGNSGSDNGDTTFIQNNYSPKAISPADTYRGTKNLLALKRKELNKSNETDED